jgi:hypothetical protein
MRSEDYTVLQGWMYNLPLTEKQRLVYAMVWGYSRDGRSRMRATASYIAEWLDCTPRHAQKIIRALEDKGLVNHEVVAWSNGKKGGVVSEFWAILPEEAVGPEPGSKEKINWSGKSRRGYVPEFVTPLRPGVRNPLTDSNTIQELSCCSKYTARRSAKKTTTTTLCLFENETGQAPGNPCVLPLPYEEDYFVDAWRRLLREPKWSSKTPGQLDQQLQTFRETNDPVLCAYCIDLAIRMGWGYIDDPAKIGVDDQDKVLAFAERVNAQKEGAAA